jgi:hypothetical protein
MWNSLSSPESQEILSHLARCSKLVEASLVNNDGDPDAFENRIPPFRGLRRLELLNMSHGQGGRDSELADILVSCPDFHDLSISTADGTMGDDISLLPKLIQRFASNTEK